jgi:hypothetical protein
MNSINNIPPTSNLSPAAVNTLIIIENFSSYNACKKEWNKKKKKKINKNPFLGNMVALGLDDTGNKINIEAHK